jgi:DNA-binding transcriptional ArsR family regulator
MTINETFKALADPTRREILRILRRRDLTAGEIADRFDLSRSTLSGHCNVLKAAGLIVSERNRSTVVYSINTSALDEAAAVVIALFGQGDGAGRRSGSANDHISGASHTQGDET